MRQKNTHLCEQLLALAIITFRTLSNTKVIIERPSMYAAKSSSFLFLFPVFFAIIATLIKAACRQESENNEKKIVSVFITEDRR